MKRCGIKLTSALSIALFMLPASVFAAGWQWLESSPASHFNAEDKKIMRSTTAKVLNEGKDGVKIGWENPETGHSGSIMPMDTVTQNGLTCRKTRFFNSAEGLSSTQVHRLCKQTDGSWKLDK